MGRGSARIVAFADPGLFASFGLPQEYDATAAQGNHPQVR
jgi:hypothetical protein